MLIPAGTYKLTSGDPLNWKVAGLRVITDGAGAVKIKQAASNVPIVQFAGQAQYIDPVTFEYVTTQGESDTGAIGITFGDDWQAMVLLGIYQGLRVYNSYTGVAMEPSIETVAGIVSCYVGSLEVFGWYESAINLNGGNGVGAGATGCVFDNVYVHNNFTDDDTATSASWPVIFRNWSEVVYNELNVQQALCVTPACSSPSAAAW